MSETLNPLAGFKARHWEQGGERCVDWEPAYLPSRECGQIVSGEYFQTMSGPVYSLRRSDGVRLDVAEVALFREMRPPSRWDGMNPRPERVAAILKSPEVAHALFDICNAHNPPGFRWTRTTPDALAVFRKDHERTLDCLGEEFDREFVPREQERAA